MHTYLNLILYVTSIDGLHFSRSFLFLPTTCMCVGILYILLFIKRHG